MIQEFEFVDDMGLDDLGLDDIGLDDIDQM